MERIEELLEGEYKLTSYEEKLIETLDPVIMQRCVHKFGSQKDIVSIYNMLFDEYVKRVGTHYFEFYKEEERMIYFKWVIDERTDESDAIIPQRTELLLETRDFDEFCRQPLRTISKIYEGKGLGINIKKDMKFMNMFYQIVCYLNAESVDVYHICGVKDIANLVVSMKVDLPRLAAFKGLKALYNAYYSGFPILVTDQAEDSWIVSAAAKSGYDLYDVYLNHISTIYEDVSFVPEEAFVGLMHELEQKNHQLPYARLNLIHDWENLWRLRFNF